MYQQSLDLQFPLTQQLSFDFPIGNTHNYAGLFSKGHTVKLPQVSITATTNSGLSVTQLEVNGNGLYIRQENKSWLKTKVANWLGVKYL